MARRLVFVLAIALGACGGDEQPAPSAETTTVEAEEPEAAPAPAPTAEPSRTDEGRERVAVEGLTIHTSLEAPAEVLAVAHESRPRSIGPVLVAGAGDAPGPRVFWLAYLTSPFSELRGRAEDEGRAAAWDADLERRIAECEENEEVPECDFCESQCWRDVPTAMASQLRDLRLVRVSWPGGEEPVVDASEVVWRADEQSDVRVRARSIEDLDGDGRVELSLGIQTSHEWSAGDGADSSRINLYVDGDTARVQLTIPRSYEEDGHGGARSHETQVTFRDRNGDGVRDFAVRFQTHGTLDECYGLGDDEEVPTLCREVDESHVATYSSEHDEWRLPEGERWPWIGR